MDKKIIFGKIHFDYIYFLLYIITIFIKIEIEINNYFSGDPELEDYDKSTYKLIYFYIKNISTFLVIIPILIKNCFQKKNTTSNEEKIKEDVPNVNNKTIKLNETNELIYTDINFIETYKRNQIFKINAILTAVFNFLEEFLEILFYIIYPDEEFEPYVFSSTVSFDIILQFISSYFILKIYFYKLQYFSLSINIIIFIIILIIDIQKYK